MKHIIKKILREEFNDFDYFNDTEPSEFDKWLYQKDPELVNTVGLFLKNYENLKPIVSHKANIYIDIRGKVVFYYMQDDVNGFCYFIKDNGFLEFFNGMEKAKVIEILKMWLNLQYNLKGYTPYWSTDL